MSKTVFRALSIRQPWAWLIVNGYKDIENRTWWSSYRGRLLIHASKAMDDMSLQDIIEFYDIPEIAPSTVILHRGGIVGEVTMVDCVEQPMKSKWFHGPCGFVFRNPKPLPFMSCRGQLGFFPVEYQF